ncbi:MAG: tetratricopeptide repeat protein [Bacteroidetes bacterium]|nr:tetratricopeptide repeat protein [Bacteroidota bacterium]
MYKGFYIIVAVIFIGFSLSNNLIAQQTAVYDEPQASYELGMELYIQEKYGAAQEQFRNVIQSVSDPNDLLRVNASYYDAACAMELENNDAEYKILNFIKNHPENSNTQLAYFQLGRYLFKTGDYGGALNAFKETDQFSLSMDEKLEYFFKTGFCYYRQKNYERAKIEFRKLLDRDNPYQNSAIYYYAHIAYLEGDYNTALIYFEKIKNDRIFKKTIPLYLVHIYHQQGNYNKVIEEGVPMYESASSRDKAELSHLIGDAYYQQRNYAEALPYLELYSRTARRSMSREDNYEMAFTYFELKMYREASNFLQLVATEEDALSQNAYYLLGYCYLQDNQKQFASSAFASASKMDFDKNIQEDALFNFIKLSMEISKDPYNTAIKNLEAYLNDYPESPRRAEAYKYLANLYLSTRNYKNALESIEKIPYRDENLNIAYRKILYYRGIELFNQNDFQEAINLFKKSAENSKDPVMVAEADFWIGESFYRMENYWGAMKYYKQFLNTSASRQSEYKATAMYNLGYVYFKRDDYAGAVEWFGNFIRETGESVGSKMVNDALVRLGDCYFISKDYSRAITYYDKALRINKVDSDYALNQKATALGALGKFNDKINTLAIIINLHPNSTLADDATFEIANTYLITNNNQKALQYYDKLVKDHPRSSLATAGLLKTGLIYYNQDRNQDAIRVFKQVIHDYPGTAEAREALNSLRNVYIDMNRVDEYYAFANSLSFASVTVTEQDSITYIAAENIYMDNRCDDAIKAFASYLQRFPDGYFAPNANYYMGECLKKAGNEDEAFAAFEQVTQLPRSRFTENALAYAARFNYSKNNHERALEQYIALKDVAENKNNILEAYAGQMRLYYTLERYNEAVEAAMNLLKTETVSNELIQEAHITLARSYFKLNDLNMAQNEYSITEKLTGSELGAEAKYHLALIAFTTGKYMEAEELIFQLAEKYGAYDYWVAKGFILLADVYVKLDNVFQARQTLQSIIDNYQGPELGEIAQEKLRILQEEPSQNR